MTEKELRRLRRQDLLQLLLSQSKDVAQLQAEVEGLTETAAQLRDSNDRLKAKLDEKDAQIEKLKGRLDQKDAEILALRTGVRVELNADGTTAGVRLQEIFEVAQNAAEEYLHEVLKAGVEAELPAPAETAEQSEPEVPAQESVRADTPEAAAPAEAAGDASAGPEGAGVTPEEEAPEVEENEARDKQQKTWLQRKKK